MGRAMNQINTNPLRDDKLGLALRWPVMFVTLWLLFTLSLCVWWVYFGLSQVDRLIEVDHGAAKNLIRYQKMLIYEGMTLIASLLVGSGVFIYQSYVKYKQNKKIEDFFLTLTHEIKTPLSGIQLQAEIIKEEIYDNSLKAKADTILESVGKLLLQLENSLFFVAANKGQQKSSVPEKLFLSDILFSIRPLFPNLELVEEFDPKLAIVADSRVLKSMFMNILHNAVVHGKSKTVKVSASVEKNSLIIVNFLSLGAMFQGNLNDLGKPFIRHYEGSGSGIGLYLVSKLAKEAGGNAAFFVQSDGFLVSVKFKYLL